MLADISKMVSAARARMLNRYSITEHVSQFVELRRSIKFGSMHSSGRLFNSLADYLREFDKAEKFVGSEMSVSRGLEVDYIPRYEKQIGDFVNQEKWETMLCSVHELRDGRDIERRSQTSDPTMGNDRWKEYFGLEKRALESDFVPFTTLAHPVRLARAIPNVPQGIDGMMLDLALTAQRRNKALELNGNDLTYAPQLVHDLARACFKAGCRVTLGSDAHHPKDVYRNMDLANSLADEFMLDLRLD